jgi:hypothetical protein
MNSDSSLDILIRTLADTAGAEKVKESLNRVTSTTQEHGKATEEAAKSVEKHSGHMKGLHKIFHALNEVVPGLGVVMQAAFSPIGAAITVAVMALRAFHEKMRETNEEFKRMEEEAAKPLTHRLEAIREATVHAATGMAELKDRLEQAATGQIGLKEQTEKALTALREQAAAHQSMAEATKNNDLAQLDVLHAAGLVSEQEYADRRLAIELEYRKKKREIAEREEKLEILRRERLVEQAEINQPGLTRAAESAEIKKEKALEDLNSLRPRSEIDEDKKRTEAALKAFEDKNPKMAEWFSGFGVNANPFDVANTIMHRENLSQAASPSSADYTKWAQLKQAADAAEREWKQAPAAEAKAKVAADAAAREADRAARKAEENQSFTTNERRDIEERRSQYDQRQKDNADLDKMDANTLRLQELGKTPVGRQAEADMSGAEATAKALEEHKVVSDESKQRLVEIASAVAGHKVSLDMAVKMMGAAANNIGIFTQDVGRLAESMRALANNQGVLQGQLTHLDHEIRNLSGQIHSTHLNAGG